MKNLRKDEIIHLLDGSSAIVLDDEPLGDGGQGEVYLVEWGSKEYAFKWYTNEECFPINDQSFKENLVQLSELKNEDYNKNGCNGYYKNFTMPLVLSEAEPDGQFGYIMDLIPDHYVSLNRILGGYCNFCSLSVQMKACIGLVESIDIIHKDKLAFIDINDGGIFFDPNNGDVLICDCDNMTPANRIHSKLGTLGYMAPEIYCDGKNCSEQTDRFSIAVILFQIMVRGRPFEGALTSSLSSEELYEEIYKNPIFCFDPNNDSNSPNNDQIQENWEGVIEDIRALFVRAFVEGITNPNKRPKPVEWIGELTSWRNRAEKGHSALDRLKVHPIPKRIQPIIIIVDGTASMSGERMNEVNDAICETIDALKDLDKKNSESTFVIDIIEYGKEVNDMYGELKPVSIIDYVKMQVISTASRFDYLSMYLDYKLTKEQFFNSNENYRAPFIMLLSDGGDVLHGEHLEELWNNTYFRSAVKVAIGIYGDKIETNHMTLLKDFTRNEKRIITSNQIHGRLRKVIKNVTIKVSSNHGGKDADQRIDRIFNQLKGSYDN